MGGGRGATAGIVAVLLCLGLVAAARSPAPEPAGARSSPAPQVERLSGPDRYATAAAVSRASVEAGVAVVYVATGADFPDALAVAPVAGRARAPVLLVTPHAVPAATSEEIERLGPQRIVLLGGSAAVSAGVEAQLRRHAPVTRLAGADRAATAAQVSASTFEPGVARVFVATGQRFPDALSGGAAAVIGDAPVLLVTRDRIPESTAAELERLAPGAITILGGEQAVSAGVARALGAYTAGPVDRLAGADRFATSAAVSGATVTDTDAVYLATGLAFPDALGGAPAAGRRGAPVLLVRRSCVPEAVRAEIERLDPERIVILGGGGAVGEPVERLAGCGRQVRVIASGLEAPWDVAFTPDGQAYVSERDTGRVLVREAGGGVRQVHRFDVDNSGEGGLLGLAASPRHASDGLLYAYLTSATDNRVVRFIPGTTDEPVLTGIPKARVHNGGRIRFGPDGMLYVTTGDAGQSSRAQDPGSAAGKILRVRPDGTTPPDNPTPGSPVYALGMRNPQGLAWDRHGNLYASEFGPGVDDEVNRVVPGGNYGWPAVTGRAGDPRFVDPIVVRQPPEASWSGVAVLAGGAIDEWEGDLFAAALRGRRLWRFGLDPDGRVTGAEALLVGEFGRLRTAVQAPDGSLWILTSNRDGRGDPQPDDDRIVRLGRPS